MGRGGTEKLAISIGPGYATNKDLTFEIDKPWVATITKENGVYVVKGSIAGYATTVKVKTKDGSNISTSFLVKVVEPIKATSIKVYALSVERGEYKKVKVEFTPSNTTNKDLDWGSSHVYIASMTQDGTVYGGMEGTATITAKTRDGSNVKASCIVTVKEPTAKVTGVSLDKNTMSLNRGDIGWLTAKVSPANAANKAVTWSSSNTNVATADNRGMITAKGSGTANITVKTTDGNKTAACTVTIAPPVSYIFYLPEWTNEALFDRERLASRLYDGDVWRVNLIELTTVNQFINGWNNMQNVDTVIIDVHATPLRLNGFGDLFIADINNLDAKIINNLIIYSCNAGHSDWAGNNVASAFRGRINGAPVLASDGTVESTPDRSEDLPYDSRADDEWVSWCNQAGSNRTDNNGWHINYQNIGTKQLTLLQMLNNLGL
ncbi:hypothetical protein AGMMS50284_6690 [Clostridia bacterium]|nr:hypothetical protein AGMMS50284_6690 [Clostridia bacterium]